MKKPILLALLIAGCAAGQEVPGAGFLVPTPPLALNTGNTSLMNSDTIAATGYKIAFAGRVQTKDHASKSIQAVGFLFGTVTKTGGSGLTVSLQTVTASGPPLVPSGTQEQYAAIPNGGATGCAFTSNTWCETPAMSANRTVNPGDFVAVVIEFNTSGRLGSDSIAVNTWYSETVGFQSLIETYNGTAWSATSHNPAVLLEFSDGTFGTLESGDPLSAAGSITYNSGSSPNEYARQVTFPVSVKTDGAWLVITENGTGSTFTVNLYSGTTVLTGAQVSILPTQVSATGGATRYLFVPWPSEQTLAANTIYYLSVLPSTTTGVSICYYDVANAAHLQAHQMGTSWVLTSRSGGAWAAATGTRSPIMGLRVSGFVTSGTGPGSSFWATSQ